MTTMMTTMMTRTGAWTTTEMMAALLERVMDDLYARGIRALYSHAEECYFLFSRDASTSARRGHGGALLRRVRRGDCVHARRALPERQL